MGAGWLRLRRVKPLELLRHCRLSTETSVRMSSKKAAKEGTNKLKFINLPATHNTIESTFVLH